MIQSPHAGVFLKLNERMVLIPEIQSPYIGVLDTRQTIKKAKKIQPPIRGLQLFVECKVSKIQNSIPNAGVLSTKTA